MDGEVERVELLCALLPYYVVAGRAEAALVGGGNKFPDTDSELAIVLDGLRQCAFWLVVLLVADEDDPLLFSVLQLEGLVVFYLKTGVVYAVDEDKTRAATLGQKGVQVFKEGAASREVGQRVYDVELAVYLFHPVPVDGLLHIEAVALLVAEPGYLAEAAEVLCQANAKLRFAVATFARNDSDKALRQAAHNGEPLRAYC